MNFNCFNPQYILVFIKYTEISNVKKSIFKTTGPTHNNKNSPGGP